MGLVDDKVVLVTGAGAGIGRASALLFAAEGARAVVCADIDAAAAQQTADAIARLGVAARSIVSDVADAAQVEAMVRGCVDAFGRLDCAHNNAGVSSPPTTTTADVDERHWRRVLDVVLSGTWLCMKYELVQMVAQGGGAIVNTASTAAFTAVPGVSPYVAAKHGVLGLTRNAALEYVRAGVRVNAICPGATRTNRLINTLDGGEHALTRIAAMQPGGRISEPDEQAQAAVWLCSDRASFANGVGLPVENGATIGATVNLAEANPPS